MPENERNLEVLTTQRFGGEWNAAREDKSKVDHRGHQDMELKQRLLHFM